MTLDILLLLVILAIAIVLLSFEWISADVTALGVLVTLVLTGLLPPDQAFAGFGSDTVIMILGLLILTAALVRTGVVDSAGRFLMQRTGANPDRLLPVVMLVAIALSSIMSNTAATAFFIPIVIGLARRARLSISYLLMPLAFAAILASSITLVSTSTNLVVSGIITQYELEPIGMFELTPVGIPIAAVGFFYMLYIGRRLIPDRTEPDELTEGFGLRPYLTETLILPDSALIGKTLSEARLGETLDLTVLRVVRNKRRNLAPHANLVLAEGDVLLVEGQRDDILKIKETAGIDIRADVELSDPDLETQESRLAEVIVLPRSPVIGRTLKGIGFRERFGLQVLAINRHGETILRKLSKIPLRLGDVLLIQGRNTNVAALEKEGSFRVIGTIAERRVHPQRSRIAVGVFLAAIAAAALDLLSFPVAVILGAVIVFLTRCITPEEAYREVEWRAIILIGSMLALGAAMEHTGTARYLAMEIVRLTQGSPPIWLLGGFFALTVMLTQPMSNQAAAVVILPIAIQTALQLGLNPRTFAVMIAVAASTSFLTPLEPACLMVYGVGRYRFADFLRVGSLLTVLIFLVAILLVPLVWPFAN